MSPSLTHTHTYTHAHSVSPTSFWTFLTPHQWFTLDLPCVHELHWPQISLSREPHSGSRGSVFVSTSVLQVVHTELRSVNTHRWANRAEFTLTAPAYHWNACLCVNSVFLAAWEWIFVRIAVWFGKLRVISVLFIPNLTVYLRLKHLGVSCINLWGFNVLPFGL